MLWIGNTLQHESLVEKGFAEFIPFEYLMKRVASAN